MSPEPIRPGTRIGHVVVTRVLGTGGFGTVYEGRDEVLDRVVALKIVDGDSDDVDDDVRTRLLREARALARLRSPNVVAVYRAEPYGPRGLAIEMEHVEGGSLADLLAEDGTRLAPATVVALAREIAEALSSAHQAGVVHGDLKPENVLRTLEGRVKLVDFGLAQLASERHLESTGSAGGSPLYMAPERIAGSAPVPASDIWSLGVLLYRMLVGRLPFVGTTLPALFFAILEDPPGPLGSGIPAPLARLVESCLSKSPIDRPASDGLSAALARTLEPGAQAAAREGVPEIGRSIGPTTRTSPMFGRDEERAVILGALDSAATGAGRTLLVSGDVGIGKTALVRWARIETETRGFRWIEVTLSPSIGLLRPLLAALRRTLALRADAESDAVPVESASVGPAVGALRAMLRDERRPAVESAGEATFAIESLLAALSRKSPVALVVESLHAAERGEISLLRDLARRLAESCVLLILTARTTPSDDGGSGGALAPFAEIESVVRLPLAPFEGVSLYGLLETATGTSIAPDVVRPIVARAEGNPLLALELLRHARSGGAIVESSVGLRASESATVESLPARLVDLFAARLGVLPRADRELLEVAAIDGLTFDAPALSTVLGRPLWTVLRQLQRLSRETGIVVPRDAGFHFSHAVMREVLVDRVAPALRREVHGALAAHLATRANDVDPERLGTHLEASGAPDRAVPAFRAAFGEAMARFETERARALIPRARLRPEDLNADVACAHPDLLLSLARVHSASGGSEETAESIYALLSTPEVAKSDPTIPRRAGVRRAHLRYFSRGARGVDEVELRRAALELPPSNDQHRAMYLLGVMAKFRGDLVTARDHLVKSLEVMDRIGGSTLYRSAAVDQLASIEMREGQPATAALRYEQAAVLSDRGGAHHSAAISRVNGVLADLAQGVTGGLDDRLDRAIRALELGGMRHQAAHARVVRAHAYYASGDTDRAIAGIEDVLSRRETATYRPASIGAKTFGAHLAIVVGDAERAAAFLSAAAAEAHELGDAATLLQLAALECNRACLLPSESAFQGAASSFIDRLREAGDPAGRADACALAIETTLYGGPLAFASIVESVLVEREGRAAAKFLADLTRRAAAFQAFRDESAPVESIEAEAIALLKGPRAGRPATLEAIGELLRAEAARRRGNVEAAGEAAARAAAIAKRLRHVLLQRACDALASALAK